MSFRFLAALALLLPACSLRPGTSGDAGLSEGRLVWVDATGAPISAGGDLFYTDADGRRWALDPETARVASWVMQIWYDADNCAGNAYTGDFYPGWVFRLWGEPGYRVRPRDMQTVVVATRSTRLNNGTCTNYTSVPQRYLPVTDALLPSPPLLEPTLSFASPLHLAPR